MQECGGLPSLAVTCLVFGRTLVTKQKRNLKRRSRARCTDEISFPQKIAGCKDGDGGGYGDGDEKRSTAAEHNNEWSSNGDDLPSNAV